MVYKLCNGDITKRDEIYRTKDVIDYYEWANLQKYDGYLEAEMSRRMSGKGTTKEKNNFKGF